MNIHLQQIIELAGIDKEIDSFEPRIAEVKANLDNELAKKAAIDEKIEALEAAINDEKIKRQKNELHLTELRDKLDQNSKKSGEVKSEREMKALQLEEDIAKEQIDFANEEIDRLEKVIDNKLEEIEAFKAEQVEIDNGIDAMQADVEAQVAEVNKERDVVFAKKDELVGKMNRKGLTFYEKIRRWAKNTTAVPLKKQACYGCHMKISDKVYAEVIKGEEIVTCPHCGRLLYIEEESEEAAS
jgi:predicted  nucleic acid-binding Zn-ribbon protein